MHRPLVWLTGSVVLVALLAGLAAWLHQAASDAPVSTRSAPRVVVVRSEPSPQASPTTLDRAGAPEVVVLGDYAPARAVRAPEPASAPRRAVSRSTVVREIVYVDAPAPASTPAPPRHPEPLYEPTPVPDPAPVYDPAPVVTSAPVAVPRSGGSSRAGDIAAGAAIGAGVGAVLGGSRGAMRGAIGGAVGGAIGGRSGAVLGGVLGSGGARGGGSRGGSCPASRFDLATVTSSKGGHLTP